MLANLLTRIKLIGQLGLRRLSISFLAVFGILWLLLEPAALFFPGSFELGWKGYLGLVLISSFISFCLRFPKLSFAEKLSSPDSEIEIKVGNLFDETGHLVIGFNDVFDTELGSIIKPSSVQGQFLTKVYKDDIGKLDKDIELALQPHHRSKDTSKKLGKNWRYPIGTTITLGFHDKRFFLCAYGYMGSDTKVQSNADYIWTSLSSLWEEVRLKGNGINLAIPVIGVDLARTNIPRMTMIKLIVTSFIVATKKEFITRKLTIVIYSKDIDSVNLYDIEEFLKSACF
jgi:hypothetical protein